MAMLMIYAGPAAAEAAGTRTGGVPLAPPGFVWPRCRTCGAAMQFLAQIALPDSTGPHRLVSVFHCASDPGMCDEWDPELGGNRALVFPLAGLVAAVPPADGVTALDEVCAVGVVEAVDPDYRGALGSWVGATGRSEYDVLGHLGGVPAWIQADQTPHCPRCGRDMDFVAGLEPGRDPLHGANYGDAGMGYVFACAEHGEARFIVQGC